MDFKYGASFNCTVNNDDIGGGGEGCTSLDYLSNDLEKLKAAILSAQDNPNYKITSDHRFVENEEEADLGGVVVAVVVDSAEDENYAVAVIFELNGQGPTIVE